MLNNKFSYTGKLLGVVRTKEGCNKIVLLDAGNDIVDQLDIDQGVDAILRLLAPYKSKLEGIVVTTSVGFAWLIEALIDDGFQVHLVALQSAEGSRSALESDLVFARSLAKRLYNTIQQRKRKRMELNWPAQLHFNHYLR